MLLAKFKIYGLIALAVGAFGALTATAGYLQGKAAAEREQAAAGLRAFAAAVETATDVGRAVVAIGHQLRAAIAASQAEEVQSVRTVTRIVREHPDFAAVRRPPELERLRRAELEAINAAAEADRLRR